MTEGRKGYRITVSTIYLILFCNFTTWPTLTFASNQTINSYDGDVSVVRDVYTPWPVVLCEMVWALGMGIYNRHALSEADLEISVWSHLFWGIIVIQAVGAIVFTIASIVRESKNSGVEFAAAPSIGVIIIVANLAASSYQRTLSDKKAHYYCGMLGLVLTFLLTLSFHFGWVASSIVSNGTTWPPSSVVVTQYNPCDFIDGYGITIPCNPTVALAWVTTPGDWASIVEWVFGVIVGWAVVMVVIRKLGCCTGSSWLGDDLHFIRKVRNLGIAAATVGGGLAITIAVLRCLSVSLSPDSVQGIACDAFNCTGGTLIIPGSVSGFLGLWASDGLSVVSSIFAW